MSSLHRHRTLVTSRHHHRTFEPSSYRTIASSFHRRKHDGAIVQFLTAWPYPDFMYFDYGLLPLPDLEDRLTVSVTGQQGILTPPNP